MAAAIKLYRVTTPAAGFTGEVGRCQFIKGVYEGPVDDGPLAYFTGAGYTVEEVKASRQKPASSDASLEDQLVEAYQRGVDHTNTARDAADADAKAAADKQAADDAAAAQAQADADAKAAAAAKTSGSK